MASFLSGILAMFTGGAKSDAPAAPVAEPQTHGDCVIYASPISEGSQLRLAGRIEKTVDGEVLVRHFIRADLFTSMDEAVDCTFRKARQIIDQNGPSLFADGEKSRAA